MSGRFEATSGKSGNTHPNFCIVCQTLHDLHDLHDLPELARIAKRRSASQRATAATPWRKTLDHFDAIKVGLTATPAAHAKAYFKQAARRRDFARAAPLPTSAAKDARVTGGLLSSVKAATTRSTVSPGTSLQSSVPRHSEIGPGLVRKICQRYTGDTAVAGKGDSGVLGCL
jgi:hypothetical protein